MVFPSCIFRYLTEKNLPISMWVHLIAAFRYYFPADLTLNCLLQGTQSNFFLMNNSVVSQLPKFVSKRMAMDCIPYCIAVQSEHYLLLKRFKSKSFHCWICFRNYVGHLQPDEIPIAQNVNEF